MNWYCNIAPGNSIHGPYHDSEYGLPRNGESVLFELLSLEILINKWQKLTSMIKNMTLMI